MINATDLIALPRLSHARLCACFVCREDNRLPVLDYLAEIEHANREQLESDRAELLRFESLTSYERQCEEAIAYENGDETIVERLGVTSAQAAVFIEAALGANP